ncbi:MAG: NADH-quinone oxidoreductase subunit J [Opitutaceae bacterium]|nr:NADH-quinone oxidoreductase subunit J [Opitutaceae bacterium]
MTTFPFSDYIITGIFCLVVATTVAGALVAALSTRIIRGVTGLMICCLGLAGLYYFLNSPFLALMEILIYVGAVCVTIIFGVMLAEPDEPAGSESRSHYLLWGGLALLVSAVVFATVASLSLHGPWAAPAERVTDGSIRAIGLSLLTTYSMAFELISLVLFVAIIGALVIARAGRTKE